MESTINSNPNKLIDINDYNLNKIEDLKEKNEIKNSRIETSLSLRKKKLNDYISEKRKKYMKEINNDDYDVCIKLVEIIKDIPKLLVEEFDIYEDKLSVIHQFLNNDFTLLHGMNFDPDKVKQYILYKLTNLTFEETTQLYEDNSEENLKLVFYDVIKIINESKSPKILYGASTIILNFVFTSLKLVEEFRKINGIWKRFQEISELKIPDIIDNIITIMINLYSNNSIFGREYILSNYSRYTKQILINFFKTFDNESKKNNVELELFMNGVSLIKRLIEKENNEINKSNDFDVIVKMKYIYDDLTKMFITAVSGLINELNVKMNPLIYKLLKQILQVFSAIAKYCNEETYEMNEFKDKYFVTTFFSLIRIIILNKNNELQTEYILDTLNEIYNFIGLLFSLNSDKTQIYCENNLIIITEELLKKIGLNNTELVKKIIFFFSNYVDDKIKCRDIIADEFLLVNIKEYAYRNINEHHCSYNIFCLIENGFYSGDDYCKELIIKNFTYFIIERIKILYQPIINGQFKLVFNKKIRLLLSIILFLENEKQKYCELLTNLINLFQNTSLEEYLINIQTNAKQIDQEVLAEFMSKLKNN